MTFYTDVAVVSDTAIGLCTSNLEILVIAISF